MSDLNEQLAEAEKEFGNDHRFVQMIRDQIAAKGTSVQELWLTGSVPKQGNSTTPNRKNLIPDQFRKQ